MNYLEGTVTLYMEDWELVIEILENTTENVSSLMEKEIRKIIDEIKFVMKKPTDNCNYQSAGGKMSDISTSIITQEVNNDRT